MSKAFFIGICSVSMVLLVVVAVYMYAHQKDMPSVVQPDTSMYSSATTGIHFQYPNRYVLTEREDSYNGAPIHVITLVDASSSVPDMSEGPTAISIIELPATTTPLEAWVRDASISNFYLSPDKQFTHTTIAGEPTLVYRYSGLYESDALALQHIGHIYLLAVSWIDANDRIRTDFKNLSSSVTFTK